MVLGDLGADVLKIEGPDGDETRTWGPPFAGQESAYFLALNRNKRSIVLDLRDPVDARRFLRLVRTADVLVDNFRPGLLTKWGLGSERLREVNPRLVHCSISAFGEEGPYRDYPGFDPVIEAMSGLMSITGPKDRFEPYKVGVAIVDVLAALYATSAITGQLLQREITGRGGHSNISLFDVSIASLVNVASSYLVSGELPSRHGNDHPNIAPFGVYATRDELLMICVGSDRQWRALCEALEIEPEQHPELATNEGRVVNRARVRRLLEGSLSSSGAADWALRLMKVDVPAGAIRTLDQVVNDEHVIQSGLIRSVEHITAGNIRLVAPPFKINGQRPEIRSAPPPLGYHQDSISDWEEASPADVDDLDREGHHD